MRHRLKFGALLLTTVAGAVGCGSFGGYNIPPAERLMHPGPGVTGPGPGVLPPQEWTTNQPAYVPEGAMLGGWAGAPGHHGMPAGAAAGMGPGGMGPGGMPPGMGPGMGPGGMPPMGMPMGMVQTGGPGGEEAALAAAPGSEGEVVPAGFGVLGHHRRAAAAAAGMGGGMMMGPECLDEGGAVAAGASVNQDVQLWFGRPESMQVQWDISGSGDFNSSALITPARAVFQTGGIYRIKISNIGNRPGLELYPSVEIAPPSRRTGAFLAHSAIPIQFTEEDLDQVSAGNFVTKVIYLPDPEFQELAVPGVRTLVSTRLDPGLDPIEEADRRGAILAIIRMGNKDMELPQGASDTVTGEYQASAARPRIAPATYSTSQEGEGPVTAYLQDESVSPAGLTNPAAFENCPPEDLSGTAVAPMPPGMAPHPGVVQRMQQHHEMKQIARANMPLGPQTMAMAPGGMPQPLIAGYNLPQYGMPQTGTPIGLPGPPHIPLGSPAGLQKHVMKNWTKMHIPDPTSKVKINVKQRPGLSYPQPASRAWVVEDTIHPNVKYGNHNYGLPAAGYQQSAGMGGAHHGAAKGQYGNGIFGHFFDGASGEIPCATCQ
ncbi:MAG: hypothetical protein U0795_10040 [Pirellulales bacterium]